MRALNNNMHPTYTISSTRDRVFFKDVITHPESMKGETEALERQRTLCHHKVLYHQTKRQLVLNGYTKIKYNQDGSVEKHKVRLMAKGDSQTQIIDFK